MAEELEEIIEEDVEEDRNIRLTVNKVVCGLNVVAGVTAVICGLDGLIPVWLAVLCAVPAFTIAIVLYRKVRPQNKVADVNVKA